MAVLETIRVKFGIVITVLIAVALLSFIIDPQTLQQVWYSVSSDNEVGQIDSKSISYEEFQKEVDKLTSLYGATGEEQQNEVNNMAWQAMVNKYLFVRNANKAGINVSDNEMVSIISGNIPSPVLSQNPYFVDENGVFSVDRVIEMSKYASSDESGQVKSFWNFVQNEVKNEMYYSKYLSLLNQSNFNNPLMAANQIAESNNTFDVEFVMVPFDVAGDTTIVVSEQEVKDFYTAHQNLFPCIETRDLHYVVVEVEPETEDAEYEKLDSVLNNVNGIENFRKAAMDNGYVVDATPVAMYANTLGSVTGVENIVKWSFKEETGAVSDIYTIENNDNTYLVVAALGNITPEGYLPVEDLQVRMMIERTLYMEKAADKKLAEVNEKVNGLTDLKEIAKALGTQVSTKKNLTFASSDFDPIFTGAASVAEEGVVNAPIKGSNGIYVYKVANRSVGSFFTDSDMANKEAELNMMYSNMLQQVLTKEGNIKNSSYLYF